MKDDSKTNTTTNESATTESDHHNTTSNPDAVVAATITYDGNSYEPSTTTVKSGETIKIVNQSGSRMEFASDPHPRHTINPQLNTGDIDPGVSKTITVTTTGTWGFHNHYNSSQRGTVIVE